MSLSKSEERVIEQLIKGHSNAEIAKALGVTEKTIKFHLINIYAKEQVESRAQLIIKKLSEGGGISKDEIKAFREILK